LPRKDIDKLINSIDDLENMEKIIHLSSLIS
jgi:hypothetical protein